MPVNAAALDEALAAIERHYPGSVHSGDKSPQINRIPTGSLELDWATGGGIPVGRWIHAWGPYSSGKSLTCWNVIREAQKLGLDCSYFNIEKQYDPEYVKSLGVDTKKLLIIDGTTIEETGKKLEALMGSVHVHVLDSLKAAISVDELSAKLEEWRIGLAARAWGKVLRRAHERFDASENTVIMVNHAAVQMQTGGEGPPGGRFIDHLSSLTIQFKRGRWLYRDEQGVLQTEDKRNGVKGPSGDAEPAGFEIQARVTKSRVGQPLRPARMRYEFDTHSLDAGFELVKAARYTGIAEQAGPWFKLPDGTKCQGEGKLRAALLADEALAAQIRERLLNTNGAGP